MILKIMTKKTLNSNIFFLFFILSLLVSEIHDGSSVRDGWTHTMLDASSCHDNSVGTVFLSVWKLGDDRCQKNLSAVVR